MDEMVYQTQRWLNKTYGNDSRFKKLDLENTAIKGKTGWATIYALTRALQIELGIESTADSFGPSSRRLYAQGIIPDTTMPKITVFRVCSMNELKMRLRHCKLMRALRRTVSFR